ncbi:MAG: deoxyribonuclease V [Desulfobacterales bacterium]|nr:deoxyribonuclease V [Desulfobacterales bacterium]
MSHRFGPPPHPWDVTPAQAIAIQRKLRHQVVLADHFAEVNYVAGVDAGFEASGKMTRAAVAVLKFPELTLEAYAIERMPTSFPYVPGLLSFREAPAILKAIEKLNRLPDLILCDGQGIAHQRRLGIASHIGLITGLPAIGVAKSRLIGEHTALPREKGSYVKLRDNGEYIGVVLRSRSGVKPIYVSPGHKISFKTAIYYTMGCLTRFRLPETTRWAHRLASEIKISKKTAPSGLE